MSSAEKSGLSPLQRALIAIEELHEKVDRLEQRGRRPLAVVGMACRFPAGNDPDEYIDSLLAGRDAVRARPPGTRPGWSATRSPADSPFPPAGYLDADVSAFDPGFFGISPREAASIDPQQRLLLECTWEALEYAGIDPRSLEGTRGGVFIGLAGDDYAQLQIGSARARELLNPHYASGIGHSMASGRLAYLFGLTGPAITVDTACSSSLVALHLACQSLRADECDMALAGGSNLILGGDLTRAFQQARMLSADGCCKAFSAGADGFGRGEGCGVVVLKRLADAEGNGDRILAVVRGTAVNQDGASSGLTAPNGRAQEQVIRAALEQAGLTPEDIGYIEAHGTGTELGDPIEARALGAVFASRSTERPVLIGSVKANIGHVEAAAGIAGFIKVVQALRRREIPPLLHFDEPSPHIPWEELSLRVASRRTAFPETGGKRRAGVSSFGFSGTNAHVILEEASDGAEDQGSATAEDAVAHVLPLSARSGAGLRSLASRYAEHFATTRDSFTDLAFTAGAGRAHFEQRLAVVATTPREAASKLRSWLDTGRAAGVSSGTLASPDRPKLAFLYSGQGGQHPGMGWRSHDAPAAFRDALATCADILREHLDVPLLDVLDPEGAHAALVHRTDYAQPAIFAVQYALTEQWRVWGIRPYVVCGHSIGEYAAAHLAGVFRLEDALALVAARGRLMQDVERAGRMMAVMAGEDVVARWVADVEGPLSIAAVNADAHIVVSGAVEAVDAIEERARSAGVATRSLKTSQAFHSPLMDEARTAFLREIEGVELRPASAVRMVSSATGRAVEPGELADPTYWAGQLRAPVLFREALATVADLVRIAVEIGPHHDLASLVSLNAADVRVRPSMMRERPPRETMLEAVGALYADGIEPAWPALEERERPPRRVDLPRTEFERTSLWVDLGSGGRSADRASHPLLGDAIVRPGSTREFSAVVSAAAPAFVGDHRVRGAALLPGTAYVEIALAAGRLALGAPVSVEELDLLAPMAFDGVARRIHTAVEPESPTSARVEIRSAADLAQPHTWTLHASARVTTARRGANDGRLEVPAAVRERCPRTIDAEAFYGDLAARGYDFGPLLRGVREIHIGKDEALAHIVLPDTCASETEDYELHPLLLDASLQAVASALGDQDSGGAYLPFAVDRVDALERVSGEAWAHVRVTSRGQGTCTASVALFGRGSRPQVLVEGVAFREMTAADSPLASGAVHRVRWVPMGDGRWCAATAAEAVRTSVFARADEVLIREAVVEDAAAYDAFTSGLEEQARSYALRALVDLGWAPDRHAGRSVDQVASDLGVVPGRRRLLARILDAVGGDASSATGSDRPEHPSISARGVDPEEEMLARCGPHVADGLKGLGNPLELLFPAGDTRLAERMYHETPLARVLGRCLAEAVAEAVGASPAHRPFRILEVGGGTGGTTRHILERLAPLTAGRKIDYTFTDVSRAFVEKVKSRLPAGIDVSYGVFDLDRRPEEQDLALGSYDVVVAANCLHAAKDLERAVSGVGRLLRPGGLLAALEVFEPHLWFDLTVGLTDGWWHFTDTALRGRYPCVPPSVWERVLRDAGYAGAHVKRIADLTDGAGVASRGQGVVLATRDVSAALSKSPWLIVTGESGLGADMARALESSGVPVRRLDPARLKRGEGTDRIGALLAEQARWGGILHCVEPPTQGTNDEASLRRDLELRVGSLLAVAKAVSGAAETIGRVAVVTRGGQMIDSHDADLDPAGAALWGLVRTMRLEIPGVACVCFDLPSTPAPEQVSDLMAWLAGPVDELEVALRAGAHRAPRLLDSVEVDPSALPPEYRLERPTRRSLEDLRFEPGVRSAPGPGEVEILVAATGLNFKDVLNVLGLYPGDAGPLGSECAGVVVATGSGVSIPIGTPVMAVAGRAFGRHVVADADLVAPIPVGLSFAQAAALPIAYLTAHFALVHLGRLGPDDRVLIHAAAGGVGMAACAIAKRVGAEVFATAGSETKREALRSRGIAHLFDSRSAGFVEGVKRATNGRGVTVVLNSLADEMVDHTFEVIAPSGRFLEIGKRGIWSPERVAGLGRDIEYHVIDWGRTFDEDSETVAALWREVTDQLARGDLPPLPVEVFPLERIADAFRHMAQARHMGKIVLTHPVLSMDAAPTFRADATYLVTGGSAGIGLETAAWMGDQGARHLVLASRRELSPETEARLEELRRNGVTVVWRRCDVSDRADVSSLMTWLRAELPPLKGVIHSAGTLSDRSIDRVTWSDFEAVFGPKVFAPHHVADATRDDPLELFVAYSSIASVLGSAGQANHAAANAFLDAFAGTLWREGTMGMSLAWGPWSETGAAARDDVLERTRTLGLGALGNEEGRACLAHAFAHPEPLLVPVRIDDVARLRSARPGPFLRGLGSPDTSPTAAASAPRRGDSVQPLAALLDSTPAAARRGALVNHVRERARRILGMSPDVPLDAGRPLGDYGLDSLLAVELRNTLGEDSGRRLPTTLVFDHPNVAAIADYLLALHDGALSGPGPTVPLPEGDTLDSVETLSDDEVDRLLMQKLENHG